MINLEEKIEQANLRWETVVTDPEDNSWWGFFAYGDGPPAAGGGFVISAWFPERTEMLEFIAQVLPYSPPGRSDLDWGEVALKTANIIEKMISNQMDDETGITQLNDTLVTFSQLEWMGTFSDLLAGNHSYANYVREEFWSTYTDGENVSAKEIDNSRLGDFKEFLASWGI